MTLTVGLRERKRSNPWYHTCIVLYKQIRRIRSWKKDLKREKPSVPQTMRYMAENPNYTVKDAEVVHSKEELLALIKKEKLDTDDIFIIGGESLYKEFLPLCDTAIITKINLAYEADAYFPNLDEDEVWECVEEGEEQTCFDMEFYFTTYKRKTESAESED